MDCTTNHAIHPPLSSLMGEFRNRGSVTTLHIHQKNVCITYKQTTNTNPHAYGSARRLEYGARCPERVKTDSAPLGLPLGNSRSACAVTLRCEKSPVGIPAKHAMWMVSYKDRFSDFHEIRSQNTLMVRRNPQCVLLSEENE